MFYKKKRTEMESIKSAVSSYSTLHAEVSTRMARDNIYTQKTQLGIELAVIKKLCPLDSWTDHINRII